MLQHSLPQTAPRSEADSPIPENRLATSATSPTERTRLVGILGMLGSDHLGERAAAAALASRLVRDKGLTWDDVVAASPAPQPQPSGPQDGSASRWQDSDTLATCLRWLGQLTTWEVGFVVDLRTKRRSLSPAQRAKLQQIAESLRLRGCV